MFEMPVHVDLEPVTGTQILWGGAAPEDVECVLSDLEGLSFLCFVEPADDARSVDSPMFCKSGTIGPLAEPGVSIFLNFFAAPSPS